MLSFVIAEEDLRIETSYPFNEVTAVFLLNNSCYHRKTHGDEEHTTSHTGRNISATLPGPSSL